MINIYLVKNNCAFPLYETIVDCKDEIDMFDIVDWYLK